ncbi:hypothetical protein NRY68_14685 [Acidithiobacillus ferrooxidans]|nr:hypothetical protein [Acidithiobacillus ferrooxidans]MCR1347003.1 hypothetical protein [Acidithiobacillus ferrooxidans]MCR1354000.1 hypothetical protein [Acidithiobacillus ferrooxidans]
MTCLPTGANGFVGQYMQAATPCTPLRGKLDLRDQDAVFAACNPNMA